MSYLQDFIERAVGFFIILVVIPYSLYPYTVRKHCVASLEHGTEEYLSLLQSRCPNKKDLWVLPRLGFMQPAYFMQYMYCKKYHVVSSTSVMSKVQVFNQIADYNMTHFVTEGSFHLIEGTCNDMWNPTSVDVCRYGATDMVVYNHPHCMYGAEERVLSSNYTDYIECAVGSYRNLMMKFVDAKMVRYLRRATTLNRVTFHWPLTGTDKDCNVLDEIFV